MLEVIRRSELTVNGPVTRSSRTTSTLRMARLAGICSRSTEQTFWNVKPSFSLPVPTMMAAAIRPDWLWGSVRPMPAAPRVAFASKGKKAVVRWEYSGFWPEKVVLEEPPAWAVKGGHRTLSAVKMPIWSPWVQVGRFPSGDRVTRVWGTVPSTVTGTSLPEAGAGLVVSASFWQEIAVNTAAMHPRASSLFIR